jgi:hypothetical protein
VPQDPRDRRRSESAGRAIPRVVAEDPTPPPQRIPIAGRTPTPDDVREKLNELTDAVGRVWGVRDVDKRLDRMQDELGQNTRSTVRMEAVVDQMVLPALKEQMAKLDTCLHHLAASSHIAASVVQLGQKLDAFGGRFAAIEKAQGEAAIRFEEHDARDEQIAARVAHIEQDVGELKQARTVADTTAKVKKQTGIRPWWFSSKGVAAVAVAIAGAIATVIAATQGGCT